MNFGLSFLIFESVVLIFFNTIFFVPEVSEVRSVQSLFSLALPEQTVDFLHHLICDSSRNFWKHPLSEFLYQILDTLFFIVNGCFFKDINDPLIIRWRDVNIVDFQFFYFFFSNFILLLFEGPPFFNCILVFVINGLNIFHVPIRNFLASWIKLFEFKVFLWIFNFEITKHIWYYNFFVLRVICLHRLRFIICRFLLNFGYSFGFRNMNVSLPETFVLICNNF